MKENKPIGDQIVNLAAEHIGEDYVLGSLVPKDDPNHKGPWDCAEFASWLVYQISGELFGCSDNSADPHRADAYTGFWKRDAEKIGKKISVEEASRTAGAMILRVPKPGAMGHIVVSDARGGTVEAHSTKRGVIRSTLSGRRWDYGILVPGVGYIADRMATKPAPPSTVIYQLEDPYMRGDVVRAIQIALCRHNWPVAMDGVFGPKTSDAVVKFQKAHGLVADGEVGPLTAEALGIPPLTSSEG